MVFVADVAVVIADVAFVVVVLGMFARSLKKDVVFLSKFPL